MRTCRSLLVAIVVLCVAINSASAKERGVPGAHRDSHHGRAETQRERQRRLNELEEAVKEFDDQAKRRWEEFSKEADNTYDRLFEESMKELVKKGSSRFQRLNGLSRMNVVKKLPTVAANVHKEISPKVHEQVKKLFDQFVAAEVKLVAEFQRFIRERFPDLIKRIDREARVAERKEVDREQDATLLAWSAFCRAQMLSALPQPGESYNNYFARMNARYWGIIQECTEQYIARMQVSNQLYMTRLTAFNQAYWANMEASNARYSAYISISTQLYYARMASSTQLYANYIANSTQSYAAYIRNSTQSYINYIRFNDQMYWSYIRYWNAIYYKRLGLT
jgi:hypothetical protein